MTDDREDDYAVGYGKPPAHSRFRKGQSGNPAGRRRGSRNLMVLLKEELDKSVAVREGGKVRRVRKRDALIASMVNKALQGEPRTTNLLMTFMQRAEPTAAQASAGEQSVEADDQKIIAAFLATQREDDAQEG
ncbi:DUF5681 domain-containing protein [Neoroseomonas lacus]|nr:DUF5681 domain-containing protein [Neoroseomonas lacus]